MNDEMLRELKIVVERAVRPVRASLGCKRPMREELLAHLVAIFEEEAERLGDERAALDRARQRFGDPEELTAQLQACVPRRDWLARSSEQQYRGALWTGESPVRGAARCCTQWATSLALTPTRSGTFHVPWRSSSGLETATSQPSVKRYSASQP